MPKPYGIGDRILCIVAHPDDEVLGCGATICKHIEQGDTVRVIILGEGMTSRNTKNGIAELKDAARKAQQIIGYQDLELYDCPDQRFDTMPFLDIVQLVERRIIDFRPTIVYTHWEGDLNLDHQLTFRAVLTALRPGSNAETSVRRILSFLIPTSSGWGEKLFPDNLIFSHIGNDWLVKKEQAFACYDSELKTAPSSRSVEGITVWAKFWGGLNGTWAAEPFLMIRETF